MITIINRSKDRIDKKLFEKVAKIVLKGENVKIRQACSGKAEMIKDVSVVLVGEQEIKTLNKKYRKKDKATDVLSFNYGESGEIIICPGIIRKNAEKFKNPFKKEIVKILIHGLLHLSGYDHKKSEKEAEKMEQKENLYSEQCEESRF